VAHLPAAPARRRPHVPWLCRPEVTKCSRPTESMAPDFDSSGAALAALRACTTRRPNQLPRRPRRLGLSEESPRSVSVLPAEKATSSAEKAGERGKGEVRDEQGGALDKNNPNLKQSHKMNHRRKNFTRITLFCRAIHGGAAK
jgi:hypothetical protein